MTTSDIKIDASVKFTEKEDGTLVVEGAKIARVGIQKYGDHNEYRPEEEVFAPEHLKTIEGCPITLGHPPVAGLLLSEYNREQFQVGVTRNVRREGDFIVADLIINNKEAAQKVKDGLRGISMGYESSDERRPGVYNGDEYSVIQRNLRANHTALVNNPRCGSGCKFDEEPQQKNDGATLLLFSQQ
jgi:hypothetical protein